MTHQVFIERKRLTVLIGCRYDTIDRMMPRPPPPEHEHGQHTDQPYY